MTTLVATIVILGLLIFIHELGHFAVAKWVGIKVHDFSIGFGPKLFAIQGKETVYNMRLIPLGGFVRMAGMDPEEEETSPGDIERGFNSKTVLQRMAVIFAGAFMNFILAMVLLAVAFFAFGLPTVSSDAVIGQVIPDSPAAKAGIKAEDKIVSINGNKVTDWQQMVEEINSQGEQPSNFVILREGEKIEKTITPELNKEENRLMIGIAQQPVLEPQGFFKSISLGVTHTIQLAGLMIAGIAGMFAQPDAADLAGPVGIVNIIGEAAQIGLYPLIQFAAILSINLGILNLLPIPALDGSRLIFLAIEGLRGRPIDPAKENIVHLVGFGFLLLLMVVVTYNDISKLFQ